jgi:hypothetical protein
MTPRMPFSPSASWTHKLVSEKQQEHDFFNLLQEFGCALRRQSNALVKQ